MLHTFAPGHPFADICEDKPMQYAQCLADAMHIDYSLAQHPKSRYLLKDDTPITIYISGNRKNVEWWKRTNADRIKSGHYVLFEDETPRFPYSDTASQLVDHLVGAFSMIHIGDPFSSHDRMVHTLKTHLRNVGDISTSSHTSFDFHNCTTSCGF